MSNSAFSTKIFFQVFSFNQQQNGVIWLFFFFPFTRFHFDQKVVIDQVKFSSTLFYDYLSFISFFHQNDINYCGIELLFYFRKKDKQSLFSGILQKNNIYLSKKNISKY